MWCWADFFKEKIYIGIDGLVLLCYSRLHDLNEASPTNKDKTTAVLAADGDGDGEIPSLTWLTDSVDIDWEVQVICSGGLMDLRGLVSW